MATTIEKIQNLLTRKSNSKIHKVSFYAEAKLEDGRIIATEEDAMSVGVAVKVLEDDGVAYPLETGMYTLEDGTKLNISEGGIIEGYGEEEIEEEMAEEEISLTKKLYDQFEEITSEEKADEIISYIKEMMKEEEKEEMSEQTEPTEESETEENTEEVIDNTNEEDEIQEEVEKTEFSSVVGELMTRLESIETKLSEIENEPAEQGVTVNPTGEEYSFNKAKSVYNDTVNKADVLKMTTSERVKFMINNKLTQI